MDERREPPCRDCAVSSPAFGACWDVANCFHGEPIETTYAAIRDRIFHVLFKDTRDGKNILPDCGEVDLGRAVQLLRQGGSAGYLSFEWEKKWEPSLEEPEVAFPIYLQHCRGLLKQ